MLRDRAIGPWGLTLIEVVVTLAVIAIVVAFAAPALPSLLPSQESSAVEPLRALLVAAKRRSERNASEVEVILAPMSGRYRLEERRPGDSTRVEEGVLPVANVRTRDPAGRFRVVFRPSGIGTGDTLAAGDRVLRVDPVTGAIEVVR
jgi:prepilin-type N-terminal cleavage/methylation domain-containing protein